MNIKVLFTTSALLGALAVILGAFAAHKLKLVLDADQLQTFDTGVRYQFYHVFAAIVAALLAMKYPDANFVMAGWLFLVGIVLFSGSLYLLAAQEVLGLSKIKWLIGPITPIGGLAFIFGWIIMAYNIYKNVKQ